MNEAEKCQAELKRLRESAQDQFIDKLLEDVLFLLEKSNRKTYEPTKHERDQFERIRVIIVNMAQWF